MPAWEGRAAGPDTAGQRDAPCPHVPTGDMWIWHLSLGVHSALLQRPSKRLSSATTGICLQFPNLTSPRQLMSFGTGGEKAVEGNGGAEIWDQFWWGR